MFKLPRILTSLAVLGLLIGACNSKPKESEPEDTESIEFNEIAISNFWAVTIPEWMHLVEYSTDKSASGTVEAYFLKPPQDSLNGDVFYQATICENIFTNINIGGTIFDVMINGREYCKRFVNTDDGFRILTRGRMARNQVTIAKNPENVYRDVDDDSPNVGYEKLTIQNLEPIDIAYLEEQAKIAKEAAEEGDFVTELEEYRWLSEYEIICKGSPHQLRGIPVELPTSPLRPNSVNPAYANVCLAKVNFSLGQNMHLWVIEIFDEHGVCFKPNTLVTYMAQAPGVVTPEIFAVQAIGLIFEYVRQIY